MSFIADRADDILGCKNTITLYHGSRYIVKNPIYGKGKPSNDYGSGFYLTENKELAAEWAALYGDKDSCYLNTYLLDISNLNVLRLNKNDPIEWAAILAKYRGSEIDNAQYVAYKNWLDKKYRNDLRDYDCIVGQRADDSYFQFISAFITNSITDKQLLRCMQLGDLGEQFVIISKKAFDNIRFVNAENVLYDKYIKLALKRDKSARQSFKNVCSDYSLIRNGKTIRDYIRGDDWKE